MSNIATPVPYTPPAIARRQPIGPMLIAEPASSDPGTISAHFEK